MFLILIHYKQPLTIIDQYLTAHREYLGECYKNDYFVVSGPRNPRVGGVIISQLTERKQLEKIIALDPFRLHDIADYEILEFVPVKYHQNFVSFVGSKGE